MGGANWTLEKTWSEHRTIDLACGSGTLLAAILTDMKRRAREQGAGTSRLGELQKLAVEEVVAGLDMNPVSLQLAAAQLLAGNQSTRYSKMGLYCMPYGPTKNGSVAVGSLELLGQNKILPKHELYDDDERLNKLESDRVLLSDDPLLEDPVKAVKDVRIVIMNPPFTNRAKMGEKFPRETQRKMRERVDHLDAILSEYDSEMMGFVDKNSIKPLFVALADKCIDASSGILSMINPTAAMTSPAGRNERKILAQRFHIHTILTSHVPGQANLSQNTNISESIIIAHRFEGTKPPTRIISLDRVPSDDGEVTDLHQCLLQCDEGLISNGWGEVSVWPAEYVEQGDWSAVVWRSPYLADQALKIANMKKLYRLRDQDYEPAATGRVLRGSFRSSSPDVPGSFPILKSKGADAQTRITAIPDEYWIPKNQEAISGFMGQKETENPATGRILCKAGFLLVTAGQGTNSARLTAVASDKKYVGNGWTPVRGLTPRKAKALAVFLNSTAGRLQIMRAPGKKLEFPVYSAKETANLRVPDLNDDHIVHILSDCWRETANMEVPQFRDGECKVRRLWDEAVARAIGWDTDWLSKMRHLLHKEPFVRGLGYNQFG